MHREFEAAGVQVNVVAINVAGGDAARQLIESQCSFDVLQDRFDVGAWQLMGGHSNDFFIYRQGGRLAPGGYLSVLGPTNTSLATPDGYKNVHDAIVAAHALGPGDSCDAPVDGWQIPGNANRDDSVDISDAVAVLMVLFVGGTTVLPCEAEDPAGPGNKAVLDVNRDENLDLSDAVYLLDFLFASGPPPVAGTTCIPVPGCPGACAG